MDVEIIRSGRKSIALEIRPDLQIVVRSPYWVTDEEIQQFLSDKSQWLEKHLKIARERKEERERRQPLQRITNEELQSLAERAHAVIPERVAYFAQVVGVSYGRITIRCQKTRWGSCSSRGNLNFNCLLMKTPPEVVDYIVVHELCHRKQMNHSKKFWAEVEKVLPDYREARKWLKENGNEIIGSAIIL